LAYGRRLGNETLIVILNSSQQPATLTLPVNDYLDSGCVLQSTWEDAAYPVHRGRIEGIRVPDRSGLVLDAGGR
jgi:hypothetical protein